MTRPAGNCRIHCFLSLLGAISDAKPYLFNVIWPHFDRTAKFHAPRGEIVEIVFFIVTWCHFGRTTDAKPLFFTLFGPISTAPLGSICSQKGFPRAGSSIGMFGLNFLMFGWDKVPWSRFRLELACFL